MITTVLVLVFGVSLLLCYRRQYQHDRDRIHFLLLLLPPCCYQHLNRGILLSLNIEYNSLYPRRRLVAMIYSSPPSVFVSVLLFSLLSCCLYYYSYYYSQHPFFNCDSSSPRNNLVLSSITSIRSTVSIHPSLYRASAVVAKSNHVNNRSTS